MVEAESFEEALKVFNGDIVRPMETEEIAHWAPEITKIESYGPAEEKQMYDNWQPWWDVLIMVGAGVIIVTWLIIEDGTNND